MKVLCHLSGIKIQHFPFFVCLCEGFRGCGKWERWGQPPDPKAQLEGARWLLRAQQRICSGGEVHPSQQCLWAWTHSHFIRT